MEKEKNIQIQNGNTREGEKIVKYYDHFNHKRHYKLDGYYIDEYGRDHALEFNGCWCHGCPRCFPRDRDTLMIQGKSLSKRFSETLYKKKVLEELEYIIHEMWACDFERCHLKYENLIGDNEPIKVRDAYYSGCTNAIVLKKDFTHNERGGYIDFCSLYPMVLKYEKYPTGHPNHIVRDFKYPILIKCKSSPCEVFESCNGKHWTLSYFGLIKLKILPPRHLYFPVLPMKINSKLLFPLCRTCAEKENMYECDCMDENMHSNKHLVYT